MVGEMAGEVVERGSLSELYVAYAPDGIRLAFLLTGDRALAEDLVQDAFVRLVGRLRHLREPNAFWAYLRRTIVNLATSHFRHRRVERTYLERLAAAPSAAENETTNWTRRCTASSSGCLSGNAPPSSCGSTRTSRTSRRPPSSDVRRDGPFARLTRDEGAPRGTGRDATMIDEQDVREMLQRRADTVPATPVDTPKVVRRGRRRLVLNGAVATVAATAIAVATFAGVDAIRTARVPADDPRPTLSELRENLVFEPMGTGSGWDLAAQNPETGEVRKIVETQGIIDCPDRERCQNFVRVAEWSSDGRWVAFDVSFASLGRPCLTVPAVRRPGSGSRARSATLDS